jgi:hypothetical protein
MSGAVSVARSVTITLPIEPDADPNHIMALGQALMAVAKGLGA